MKNIDSESHVQGKSIYTDDVQEVKGTCYGKIVYSTIAHGKLLSVNLDAARNLDGIIAVLSADDIPGENQIGGIVQDEELFASSEVHYIGNPIAMVIAESKDIAAQACKLVNIEYEELTPIVNPREAKAKGQLIQPPRTFEIGDVDSIWKDCHTIVEGKTESAGQEHLYIEGQIAYAFLQEKGTLKVISSTQGPTQGQRTIAKILGIPMHKIEVEVRRIGGGFGGKEDQATPWACFAAFGAYTTKRPVKVILERHEDMIMTGKRHPYMADYKLGLDSEGKILAYEADFYQNAGAAADLSPAVLERTLFHASNSYFIPNVKVTGYSCRTNMIPFTAFRGFGGPQGMFVMEAALNHAAEVMDLPVLALQERNYLRTGDPMHFGQRFGEMDISILRNKLNEKYQIQQEIDRIKSFNAENKRCKKGYYIMPVSFGISFTTTGMNQAGALVHVYQDGSISISTGAVEMGQGVNTRLLQVPMEIFNLPENYVHIETTSTTRVANTSPSAASSTHDLNGKATEIACRQILDRVITFVRDNQNLQASDAISIEDATFYVNGKKTDLTWKKVANMAHWSRVDLSSHGFYATPNIHFDKSTEKGHPFAYHSIGIAFLEATVDCLKGTYKFDQVLVVHDFGKSMNPTIDLGQMEGGIVQGLGWVSIEDLQFDDKGRLLSNALSTYKVPDVNFAPDRIETYFMENSENRLGLFNSKAIGEPPLMYGIGGFFALRHAILAFNPNLQVEFSTPMTPEKLFLNLWQDIEIKTQINQ